MISPACIQKKHIISFLTIVLLILATFGPCAGDKLLDGFRNPPNSAKPQVWWHWMNGAISKEGIKADLEAMQNVGLGGAQIFNVDCGTPHGSIQYMSPEWRDVFKYAVEQASRLGLELGMHNSAGWTSSGGPWIKPEQGQQELVWTETTATGPSTFTKQLDLPSSRRNYYQDIAVYAFKTPSTPLDQNRRNRMPQWTGRHRQDGIEPDTSTTPGGIAIPRTGVIDITSKMTSDGKLTWDVPEGSWTILRIGHTVIEMYNAPAPAEGVGLECDKLSKAGIDAHWAGNMTPILNDLGPLAGKTLTNCLVDSFERGGQNWTSTMREEFTKRRGYDPSPFMPALTGRVIDSIEVTERFLWDWRRTVADLFSDNYFGRFAELCHQSGMKAALESYGDGSFDNLQSGMHADMPMGEFWSSSSRNHGLKLAASLAHTTGNPIAATESFTAARDQGGWLVDPASIKTLGDSEYCVGINRFIFHRYAHQPWLNVGPGMTMGPWGMHFERTTTWWEQSKTWLNYLSRCQYLLQSGMFVADVCYYVGENAPLDLPGRDQLRPALPIGYDFDGCSADTVMLMSVKGGRIVLPKGMSYSVLSLPESRFMTVRVANKIRDLVKAGATVIGPRPQISPSLSNYPQCDQELKKIIDEVWGDCDGKNVKEHNYGKGRIVYGKPMHEILRECGVSPDFAATSSNEANQPLYIHRRVGDTDVYFVSNQSGANRSEACVFRVSEKVPELWHADTGVIEPAVYEEKGGRTSVFLQMDAADSVFVVFREKSSSVSHVVSISSAKYEDRSKIVIKKAIYEAVDGDNGSVDVTNKVARLVASGKRQFVAGNQLFGYPANQHFKQLRLEYTVNGNPKQKTVRENTTVRLTEGSQLPNYNFSVDTKGKASLKAWKPGSYALKTSSGRSIKLEAKSGAVRNEITNHWNLSFPPNLGAPASITLDRLISWSQHSDPGVRYFSGTATYETTFDGPTKARGTAYYLDLGTVKNFAEITLNGKDLGCLWIEPFRIDVTNLLRPKGNKLVVHVTNLWVNRLIGDEQFPDDCQWNGDGSIAKIPDWVTNGGPRPEPRRLAFTTWKFYSKDSPLLDSGLIGPVSIWEVPVLTTSIEEPGAKI